MPVIIPDHLPAAGILAGENIFTMGRQRAVHQDIRPLKIAILNLMPTKIITEVQLMRLLSNSALQIEVVLLQTGSYTSRNTPGEHLEAFYKTIDDVSHLRFDGLVITGAPVETLPFEQVEYWPELKGIMDWSVRHVYSTLHICWAAQAGLYHHFGVPKYPLEKKMFGVFRHSIVKPNTALLRGFDDDFPAPHSRHTTVRREDVEAAEGLELLAHSEDAGVYIAASRDGRQIFVTGHPEYDADSLHNEYVRDIGKGMDIAPPVNYYRGNDPGKVPVVTWRAHANLLYSNWLNYHVYQETPYDLGELA